MPDTAPRPVRSDHSAILEIVPAGARVLDLGCGDGELLRALRDGKKVEGRGIDRDEGAVIACVAKGVPVYHGTNLEGLALYGDGEFDFVVLSQTLQQTIEPDRVIAEMLRVGRRGIVSFQNSGRWALRLRLLFTGRLPSPCGAAWRWYDTPDILRVTVGDFRAFCAERRIAILEQRFLSHRGRRLSRFCANARASIAVFVIASP
ncbi:MAG: methionine biosynthesis protein MetW [Planctomycetes bacterium]|nr:methionine biosynthesis protein MetW [Planctomycetota bacterium]